MLVRAVVVAACAAVAASIAAVLVEDRYRASAVLVYRYPGLDAEAVRLLGIRSAPANAIPTGLSDSVLAGRPDLRLTAARDAAERLGEPVARILDGVLLRSGDPAVARDVYVPAGAHELVVNTDGDDPRSVARRADAYADALLGLRLAAVEDAARSEQRLLGAEARRARRAKDPERLGLLRRRAVEVTMVAAMQRENLARGTAGTTTWRSGPGRARFAAVAAALAGAAAALLLWIAAKPPFRTTGARRPGAPPAPDRTRAGRRARL